MIRRSRISVRPNVGRPGRAGVTAAPQDAPTPDQTPAESTAEAEDTNNTLAIEVENNNSSSTADLTTALQGRKRFAVKPKVSAAPNRASARSTVHASEPTANEGLGVGPPGSDLVEPPPQTATTTAAAAAHPHVAPANQEDAVNAEAPARETPVELMPEQETDLKCLPAGRAKKVPPKPPDKAPGPPSLPEKEAMEISERAKTLVSKSAKVGRLLPQEMRLSHLLHDQTDLQRIAKTNRLRDLLRQEMNKEKEKKKNRKSQFRVKEYNLDPSKMTMRDLVHYLPVSNPMSTYLEENTPENETVVPPPAAGEELPKMAQDPGMASQKANEEDIDNDEGWDEEDATMVPRVTVAEDGSLIIDESSLTVQVRRAKGPNPAADRDAIFERGSTTTYSSFRKKTHCKSWSSEETDMFFLAVSMVGTDFSMICQLFPHRSRSEIKNKFKKEEKLNSWRIDKAFKERRRLDLKFFSKLLEKILEFQSKKKKKRPKAPSDKKNNRKPKKKTNGGQEDPDYLGGEKDVDDAAGAPDKSDSLPQKPKNKTRKRLKKEQGVKMLNRQKQPPATKLGPSRPSRHGQERLNLSCHFAGSPARRQSPYGRMPKATKHLSYPAKEDPAADSAPPRRPPNTSTPRPKRPSNRASKKPTLAYVPAILRSPHPVVPTVEETMEEDVIDFLSPEHMEVSDNEAAHTLLTIGNRSLQSLLAHIEDPSPLGCATESKEETVAAAATSPPTKHRRIPTVKPKPNLLQYSRVARPTQIPVSPAHKPVGDQILEAMHKEDLSEEPKEDLQGEMVTGQIVHSAWKALNARSKVDVSEQRVPPDQDEPFFILSLMEIPAVFPVGVGPSGVSEPLLICLRPCQPLRQEGQPLSALRVDVHGGGCLPQHLDEPAPVQRAELFEAAGGSVKVEPPSKKRRVSLVTEQKHHTPSPPAAEPPEAEAAEKEGPTGKKRKGPGPAKLQVQPTRCTEKRQTRRTPAVADLTSEAEVTASADSRRVSADPVEAEMDTPTRGKADQPGAAAASSSNQPIDARSSDDITRPADTLTQKRPGRKPKGFLSFLVDQPSAGPSGSPGSKVKAPTLTPRVKTQCGRASAPGPSVVPLAAKKTPLKDLSVAAECLPAAVSPTEPGLGSSRHTAKRQIEVEVRMQEGAGKLLAACSQREQALEASKSLLTCNARIMALLGRLQRMREAQVLHGMRRGSSDFKDRLPCTGKLAISGLRIPLMWKDSEYFKNKGGTSTRHHPDETVLFEDVEPGFQLRVELYSSPLAEEPSSGPRRLSLLGGSLVGGPSGRRIRAAFDAAVDVATACGGASAAGDHERAEGHPASPSPSPSSALGPRYHLLAHAILTMDHVQDGFKTHDLSVSATEESPFWLPLYGNMCCRLVAQPSTADGDRRHDIYGVLRGTGLLCYRREEDAGSDQPPLFVVPVDKKKTLPLPGEHCSSTQSVTVRMSHSPWLRMRLTTLSAGWNSASNISMT
ncbi:hypothetical protein NHX12_027141 [Muraenolepis orangiensis]|uniref:Myb-like domain-containing protein n=1 Tax=Muraenolepis orangiensis TaxID=630683 RepID=A0A9Q0EE24_9TELE|nr:hypothetical protein NHX12_027141 [Muraenolepis orangiensis]